MLKVYGIQGRTSAVLNIPFNGGRAKLEVEFEHGRIGLASASRPATYSTDDPVKQGIIENSQFFTNGLIKVIRTYGAPAAVPVVNSETRKPRSSGKPGAVQPVVVAEGKQNLQPDEQGAETQLQGQSASATDVRDAGIEKNSEKPAVEEHPEITTKEDALAFLKSKGAKATDLTEEGVKKFMSKHGISFPNVVF